MYILFKILVIYSRENGDFNQTFVKQIIQFKNTFYYLYNNKK